MGHAVLKITMAFSCIKTNAQSESATKSRKGGAQKEKKNHSQAEVHVT